MRLRTSIFIAALILLAAFSLPVSQNMAQKKLYSQILDNLKAYGFDDVRIGAMNISHGKTAYTDITLDKDGFSTIRAIQVSAGYLDGLRGKAPQSVTIDGIKLTGGITMLDGLSVSGWKKQPLPYPPWPEVNLTGAQLDLDTAQGGIRLQAKGMATRQIDKRVKVQGLLWGVQNQLKLDSEVKGTIYPDGKWVYEIDIKDAAINFDKVKGSRISGWLSFNKTKTAIPDISGQIEAGRMNIGDLPFSNFNLALQGSIAKYNIVIKSEVFGYRGMLATLDYTGSPADQQVNATVETEKLDDLIDFLKRLQNSDTKVGTFTSLLLTPGNLDRLRGEVESVTYDELELQIYGPLYDLSGKIVAKTHKDGVEQRTVISLDPGKG